jgi:predicted RNA methylase
MTGRETDGWSQACDCPTAGDYTESGIVLDPFAGAGTTALVAKRLGRRFIGIDLNPEYVAMAQRRVGVDVDDPDRLLDDDERSLSAFTDGGV